MASEKMRGVITPILTPFNNDLSVNHSLYVEHAHWLLDRGIHTISPFGTTGEALSHSVPERMAALDALVNGGIDPARLMPGTGLCNLDDTVALCRHAVALGCAAVMTLPPFFFKNASDEGLFRYFVKLIETVDNPDLKVCLYHIPPMAGIGFTPELAGRLSGAFPDTVVAYKDSSGDFDNTCAVIQAAPALSVFPGAETFLKPGLENGAAGCISATCNVNPSAIRQVYDIATGERKGDLEQCNGDMVAFRKQIEEYAPIPAMKGLLAHARKQPVWREVRPPLLPCSEQQTGDLLNALGDTLMDLAV